MEQSENVMKASLFQNSGQSHFHTSFAVQTCLTALSEYLHAVHDAKRDNDDNTWQQLVPPFQGVAMDCNDTMLSIARPARTRTTCGGLAKRGQYEWQLHSPGLRYLISSARRSSLVLLPASQPFIRQRFGSARLGLLVGGRYDCQAKSILQIKLLDTTTYMMQGRLGTRYNKWSYPI
jgi:hypothetical protein